MIAAAADRKGARPGALPGKATGPALLLAPTLFVYVVALIVPMLLLAVRSLTGPGGGLSFVNYQRFAIDPFYWRVLGQTMGMSAIVTLVCAILGWPVAFIVMQAGRTWRLVMTLVIIAPLLISVVVRSFGWVVLLGSGGIVDAALASSGLPAGGILFTRTAVVIGMVHIMLPMMVVSVAAALGNIDPAIFRAAMNLGASPLGAVRRVLLPLSAPGLLAGSVLVFGVTASAFVTPTVLGGSTMRLMSTLIFQDGMVTLNFARGGALAIVLLATTLLCIAALTVLVERALAPGVFRRGPA